MSYFKIDTIIILFGYVSVFYASDLCCYVYLSFLYCEVNVAQVMSSDAGDLTKLHDIREAVYKSEQIWYTNLKDNDKIYLAIEYNTTKILYKYK